MGSKSDGTAGNDRRVSRQELLNWIVYLLLFTGYTLVFTLPKAFAFADRYVSLILFGGLLILYLNNVDWLMAVKKREKEVLFLLGIVLATVVFGMAVDSGKGAILVTANFLLIFYLGGRLELTKLQFQVLSGLFFLRYVSMLIYDMYDGGRFTHYFNTNNFATAAIYTLLVSMPFLHWLAKKIDGTGVLIAFGLISGFRLILWHRARGAFILLLCFVFFYYIWPKRWWNVKALFKLLFFFATIGSLVFVAFYVWLGTTGINFQIPFFYKNLFSGRNRIWLEIFQLFIKTPLTGIGTNVELEAFWEFNVHNAMYNLLAVYGIPVFLCILAYLYQKLSRIRAGLAGQEVRICSFCCVLAVFFESYFDVDLLWANYGLNLLLLLLMAKGYSEIPGESHGKV